MAGSSLTVDLHPLVIMQVSDHWSRVRAHNRLANDDNVQVLGALLGRQDGRHVEFVNAFEVPRQGNEVDVAHLAKREEQYKVVFPELDLVGWYITDNVMQPTSSDTAMHQCLSATGDTPLLLLKLCPLSRAGERLPLCIYESVVDANDADKIQFSPVTYQLATQPVERIGVEHVARAAVFAQSAAPVAGESSTSRQPSSTATAATLPCKQMMALHGGVSMLRTRVHVIVEYLKAVDAKTLPFDHQLMRKIDALARHVQMSNAESMGGADTLADEDTNMLTLLGNLAHTCGNMSSVVDRLGVLTEKSTSSPTGVQRRAPFQMMPPTSKRSSNRQRPFNK